MDRITIKKLKFRGLHGYHPEERQNGNNFEVDIHIHLPLYKAARSDDLIDTLDYNEIGGIVENIMHGKSVKLLETLLYAIGGTLLKSCPGAEKIEVAIRKLHPPMSTLCEYTEVKSQWPK